jgi:hypothetical protein
MPGVAASAKSLVAYLEGHALMWRLDPRTKLVWVVITVTLSVVFSSFYPVLFLAIQTVLIPLFLGYPLGSQLYEHRGTVFFIVVFIGLLNVMFSSFLGGIVLFNFWPPGFSHRGDPVLCPDQCSSDFCDFYLHHRSDYHDPDVVPDQSLAAVRPSLPSEFATGPYLEAHPRGWGRPRDCNRRPADAWCGDGFKAFPGQAGCCPEIDQANVHPSDGFG